jgi:hypothetical protein
MTTQEINNQRNTNGIFSIGNENAGWYAISRDGIYSITFCQGKFVFSAKDDVIRFYTEKSFSKRLTQLINIGY